MKMLAQWVSLVLAVVALAISLLAYQQVSKVSNSDQSAAAAVERLRADIAKEQAQQKAAAAQTAEAMKQGLQQDLKKFEEVSKLKPVSGSDIEKAFSSPGSSPSTAPTPKQ
jgi:hypothetical protein